MPGFGIVVNGIEAGPDISSGNVSIYVYVRDLDGDR